jgi:hypothetical protein
LTRNHRAKCGCTKIVLFTLVFECQIQWRNVYMLCYQDKNDKDTSNSMNLSIMEGCQLSSGNILKFCSIFRWGNNPVSLLYKKSCDFKIEGRLLNLYSFKL